MTYPLEEAFGLGAGDRSVSRRNIYPNQARSQCRLSEKLERNILNYALAASAAGVGVLAMAPSAAGSVVYTPTNQRIFNNTFLDLNHDGINDFEFNSTCRGFSIRNTTGSFSTVRLSVHGLISNQVWGKAATTRLHCPRASNSARKDSHMS